jgi:uncharacterized membrane protein YdbT with pleckstrin-like domain
MRTFTLNENEEMIAIFRKHPFLLWIAAAKYIILAILPIIALSFIQSVVNLNGYGAVLYFGYLIVLWVGFFVEWTDFMLDTWILTDERLIDVEQMALFSRKVSTLSLDRVQDITVEETGFLNTLLGIGTVFVQTAGEVEEFKIYYVQDPSRVKDLIQKAYRQGRQDILQEIANLHN